MPTYYEILGVKPDAGEEEIKAASDALLRQCYAKLRDPKTHDENVERIKQINLARDNLINAQLRKRYDTAAAEEEIKKSAPPNPWRRFIARYFDQLLFFVIFYPVYRYFADYVFFEDWALALEAAAIGIILYVLLETAVVTLLGGTLGKWMLSIRLTASGGQKPKRAQLAKRNLLAAALGFALDIPPFSLVAMALQYRKATKTEKRLTTWDRICGTAADYAPIKDSRLWILAPVVVAFMIELINMIK